MDLVTFVVACGLAARSPIFVTVGVQPDCAAPVTMGSGDGADPIDHWTSEIAVASHRFGIPEQWVRVVMRAESGGNPSATSPAGAMGLMQIMPDTWLALRARYGLGTDAYQPHDNIIGGVAYLQELLDRYGAAEFLAAYNAGPERLDDHLATGRPLPDETRRYMALLGPKLADAPMQSASTLPPNAADKTFAASSRSRSAVRHDDGELFAKRMPDGLFVAPNLDRSAPCTTGTSKAPFVASRAIGAVTAELRRERGR